MSITSANSVLILSQPILFPTPQQIQGFAVDDIYELEEIQIAETLMGVDGVLSGGFVWSKVPQRIMLQADSASNAFFDTIATQTLAAQDVYPISGLISLPGISAKFTQVNGFLENWKPAPDAKKTLMPRTFRITWNKVFPAPM